MSSTYQNSHSRWTAISQRDPAAHCLFIYGVKSTKIYCRPTCTARLARRANVVYFETAEQAQQDGFRACQKCKPDDSGFVGQREQIVLSALDLLRARKDDAAFKWSLGELAKEVGVTPSYLCRAFKKTMGVTIGEYTKQWEAQNSSTATKDASEASRSASPETESLKTNPVQQVATSWSSPDDESPVRPFNRTDACLTDESALPVSACSSEKTPGSSTAASNDCTWQSSKCAEEVLDLDFDFDEWVWTEGLPVTTGF
ncbi:hypothetical protein Q7P37_001652 [Cladosporium fusiforme]